MGKNGFLSKLFDITFYIYEPAFYLIILCPFNIFFQIKCSQYWPLSGSLKFESMQVFISESTQLADYNITTLNILNSRVSLFHILINIYRHSTSCLEMTYYI